MHAMLVAAKLAARIMLIFGGALDDLLRTRQSYQGAKLMSEVSSHS